MKTVRDEEFHAYVLDRRHELLRTAVLLTAGDRHQAEDVVQTTLTRLYLSWPLFTRAANRDGYARRALVNAFIDEQRRPWRRRERISSDLPDGPAHDLDAGTARGEALLAAMRELPPRMRATIVCRYFHDLSVAETADVLNCSQGNVKSQTARALDHLRGVLGSPAPGGSPLPATPPATQFLSSTAMTTLTRSI
jgi:RNA polymerase sigma-70 factor (sigma-E family)